MRKRNKLSLKSFGDLWAQRALVASVLVFAVILFSVAQSILEKLYFVDKNLNAAAASGRVAGGRCLHENRKCLIFPKG